MSMKVKTKKTAGMATIVSQDIQLVNLALSSEQSEESKDAVSVPFLHP